METSFPQLSVRTGSLPWTIVDVSPLSCLETIGRVKNSWRLGIWEGVLRRSWAGFPEYKTGSKDLFKLWHPTQASGRKGSHQARAPNEISGGWGRLVCHRRLLSGLVPHILEQVGQHPDKKDSRKILSGHNWGRRAIKVWKVDSWRRSERRRVVNKLTHRYWKDFTNVRAAKMENTN